MAKKVLIIGASDDPSRYSNMAMHRLLNYKHEVVLTSPKFDLIEGRKCFKNLNDVKEKIDAITMYVNPKISDQMIAEIIRLKPQVVIFNPGTENPNLYKELDKNNINHLEACTLVLLNTNQFEGIFP